MQGDIKIKSPIKNRVLYSMLVISTNTRRVKELCNLHGKIIDECETDADVFGYLLLNGLRLFLQDFKVSNRTMVKEGTVITGRLNMRETLRRQSLSRNKVCFTVSHRDYDPQLIGIVKHTILWCNRFVTKSDVRNGLNSYASQLSKYKSKIYGVSQIENISKVQTNTGIQSLLMICFLIRMFIEPYLTKNSKTNSRNRYAIDDTQVLGYIFENYVRDRLTRYVQKSKSKESKNDMYSVAPLHCYGLDGVQKYDFHFVNEDVNCITEVKYTSQYFHASHKHEIRDFMATQHDMNTSKSTLGLLIYAKLPDGELCSDDVFDVVKRDDYTKTKEQDGVMYKYRANITIDLDVDNIDVIDKVFEHKIEGILNAVKMLNNYTNKNSWQIV